MNQEPVLDTSQYSLKSILWMTTAAAMLLAHARNLGVRAVSLLIAYTVFWFIWVAVFASMTPKRKELLFWSGLIVTEAFLAVSAVKLLNLNLAYGWGMVAAVSGSFASVSQTQRVFIAAIVNSVLSSAAMAAMMAALREPLGIESSLDLAGAAGVGFAVTYFVRFLQWFTSETRQPWLVVAAWLTISVLIGNWLVNLSGY